MAEQRTEATDAGKCPCGMMAAHPWPHAKSGERLCDALAVRSFAGLGGARCLNAAAYRDVTGLALCGDCAAHRVETHRKGESLMAMLVPGKPYRLFSLIDGHEVSL